MTPDPMLRKMRLAFLFLLFQVAFLSHYAQTTSLTGDASQPKNVQATIASPDVAAPAVACTVTGPGSVAQGSSQNYTLTGGCTASSWTCTCGTIDAFTSTSVTIIFDRTDCSSASITAVGSGVLPITVAITSGTGRPLAGGVISNPSQTINYNTIPAQIAASTGTGGSCSGSYTYQWSSSTDNSSFSNISGATGQNYQPGSLIITTYYRRLTTCGTSSAYTSNTSTVTVYPQLVAGSIMPSTQTINYNTVPGTLTLSGVSGGSGSYTYQWQSSPDNSSWTNISGATSTTYSPGSLTATTYYRVAVISNGVTVYSSYAVVNVYPVLVAGSITPSSQTINYGGSPSILTLSEVSGGSGTYTYQWQSSLDNTFSSPTNVGSGTTIYTPLAGATSTLYYRVVVTSNGASGNSSSAVVTVYPALVAGSIGPSSQTINYGGSPSILTLSGVSGGSGTYTYQWQSSTNSYFSTRTSVGSGTTTYTPPTGATSVLYYRVQVASNSAYANSSTAVVNLYPPLQGGGITPATQTVNYGGAPSPLVLSGVSGGIGTYTFQWQSSPDNTFSSPTNVGSGTTTYTPPSGATSTTYYRVVVTSNGGSSYSVTAVVNVTPQLAGGTISGNTGPINYNSSPGLLSSTQDGTGGACSGNYTYQWQYSADGTNYRTIAGASASTYMPLNLLVSTYFRRQVSCGGVSQYSNALYVQVTPQRAANCTTP